jgi:insulysin
LDEEDLYETQPSRFIGHLIGHEGVGSILAYLKKQGLANALSAGAHPVCRGSAFFEIDISLTQEGLKNYQAVLRTVFQYIGMMKEDPPLQWVYDEMKDVSEMNFRFQQKLPASRFTSRTSSMMQKPLPREWLLSGLSKLRRFDAEGIIQGMQCLREGNVRLMIISRDCFGDWNMKEYWYGTEYKVEKIPTNVQLDIQRALSSSPAERPANLHLPHRNEFIPTRLEVEKKQVKSPVKTPGLIRNDELMRLWWKKDDTFWVPKANLTIRLRNSLIDITPANYVKATLFCLLVKDSLVEYSYDAEISGLAYSIQATSSGLDISVHGYNDKMSVLLEKVLTSIRELDIRSDRFEIEKERLAREYKNWSFKAPYFQIDELTSWLITEKWWIVPQYSEEVAHIQVDDVKSFSHQILQQAHVEIFAHGNLYKEDAKKMGDLVESILGPRSLPKSQWPLHRNVIIPPGSNYVYRHTLGDPANTNNSIEYYLHLGSVQDFGLRGPLQLFAQMTEERSFDQLRTKEQLGYLVWSGVRSAMTTMGYRVLIQSERQPEYLETRIDAFLLKFKQDFDAMSEEEFEGHKRSLINKRLEKPKNLDSESRRTWNHINSESYNFYQIDQDVAAIRALKKGDVQNFFARYIDPESPARAKLSVHMIAQASPMEAPAATTAEPKLQLLKLLDQYLRSARGPVGQAKMDHPFQNISPDKESTPGVVKVCIEDELADDKKGEILAEIKRLVSQVLSEVKVKAPVPDTNGVKAAKNVATSVIIKDVHAWKATLQVSKGPIPVTDLSEFEEIHPKLDVGSSEELHVYVQR